MEWPEGIQLGSFGKLGTKGIEILEGLIKQDQEAVMPVRFRIKIRVAWEECERAVVNREKPLGMRSFQKVL